MQFIIVITYYENSSQLAFTRINVNWARHTDIYTTCIVRMYNKIHIHTHTHVHMFVGIRGRNCISTLFIRVNEAGMMEVVGSPVWRVFSPTTRCKSDLILRVSLCECVCIIWVQFLFTLLRACALGSHLNAVLCGWQATGDIGTRPRTLAKYSRLNTLCDRASLTCKQTVGISSFLFSFLFHFILLSLSSFEWSD